MEASAEKPSEEPQSRLDMARGTIAFRISTTKVLNRLNADDLKLLMILVHWAIDDGKCSKTLAYALCVELGGSSDRGFLDAIENLQDMGFIRAIGEDIELISMD